MAPADAGHFGEARLRESFADAGFFDRFAEHEELIGY
jgi:hypothetical protein